VIEAIPERLAGFENAYADIMEDLRRLNAGFTADELEVVARYLEAMVEPGART
jgi:hypothetical protein